LGAESNHQLYVFDTSTQTWAVGPNAPYDGGWGSSIEFVATTGRLYEIDGRNSGGTPQGTAVLFRFVLGCQIQMPNTILLNWSAAGGRSYQVQYKTNLNQSGWANFGGATLATNSTVIVSDAFQQPGQRFYRVMLLP
jgi:hypothetical protein